MADDPDTKWLTYDEAAELLRIKPDSVRRRAAARKWPRRQGNDRRARVGIPHDAIPDSIPDDTPDVAPDETDTKNAVEVAVLEARLEAAETRIIAAENRADELRADRDEARADARAQREMLAAALAELTRRPTLFERLVGKPPRLPQKDG